MLETIAAWRLVNIFKKLDFPTFGGPIIAILYPSLITSPILSSSITSISFNIFLIFELLFFSMSIGKSSSAKSIEASTLLNTSKIVSLHSINFGELFFSLKAWTLCASVSACNKSAIHSASYKFILLFCNAVFVNSPGSANLQSLLRSSSFISFSTTALLPCVCISTTCSPV